MRLFHCTTCGCDTLTRTCLHPVQLSSTELVRCPGLGCTRLVSRDLNKARHIALGMACCSTTCYVSVYDLTKYVDGGEPEIPNGRIQVDEGLVIDLSTADYRILEPP